MLEEEPDPDMKYLRCETQSLQLEIHKLQPHNPNPNTLRYRQEITIERLIQGQPEDCQHIEV